jgi:general secretion pathway protein C
MSLDVALKRYFAAVILALVAVAAYFQASGITQLVGASFAADERSLAATAPASPKATKPAAPLSTDHATSARALLDRNPFDSVTPRPLDAVPLDPDAGGPVVIDLEHSENAPVCDGVKALLIISSPTDPRWSMAALSGAGNPLTKLVRVGDDLAGRVVQIVDWHRVVLSQGASLCQVMMFRNEKAAAAAASAAAAAAPAAPPPGAAAVVGGTTALPSDIASKIQRVSPTEFNVDRQVVDKILENQAELMRSARIVPEQENGKVVGIRLFGIRPDTLLGTLGIENGDRLQAINGFEMASPEKALEAYARLRTADHLTVQVNRRGQNVNLDFNIK